MVPMSYALFTDLFCRQADHADSFREPLKRLASPTSFHSGDTIFVQNERADSVFGLAEGMVRLYKSLPNGQRRVLAFALPGDFLELPLVERYGHSADAIGEVILCRFERDDFAKLVDSASDLMATLTKFTMRELSMARDQLALLGSNSAEKRITTFFANWQTRLSQFDALFRSKTRRTLSSRLPLPMRRQDIADFTGLTVETVSRTLTKLERKNLIQLVPKGVFLTGIKPTAPRKRLIDLTCHAELLPVTARDLERWPLSTNGSGRHADGRTA